MPRPLVLDFVYGSVEGDTFYPLDGQQRLTTLWLLHWYLALRAGTLPKDKKVLEKFSYETRISSRTFCQKLCNINITQPCQPQQHGIAAFVRNQTWFYSAYEQDPTIQSMLRMLNGTDISGSNKMDITDGIEEYCIQAELTEEKAQKLLDQLKGESPHRFLPVEHGRQEHAASRRSLHQDERPRQGADRLRKFQGRPSEIQVIKQGIPYPGKRYGR